MVFAGDYTPLRTSKYDFGCSKAIGNLETAFSDTSFSSAKAYTSVAPLKCIGNVKLSGFIALSLANNHVYDAGVDAFKYLVDALEKSEVRYFGTRDKPYAELTDDGFRVAVIGCLEPCRSRGDAIFHQEDVEALVKHIRGDFSFVYVYPHWGMEGEYTRYPSPKQQKLARRWIAAGADGVFGSHSHVPQGRETYKGKPIYYSLGNFDFDHPESRLYAGTSDRLMVEIDLEAGTVKEKFNSEETKIAVEKASEDLKNWTTWKWAKKVGAFNLRKNTASWKLRLKKNFIKTFPKFIIWQFLPKTLLFRCASLFT